MAERYEKKYTVPNMLYSPGAPVIITSGALIQDSVSKKLMVQLCMTSLSEKEIAFIRVSITPTKATGESAGEDVTYLYTELRAKRDDEFGRKAAIILPQSECESFRVSVQEVGYADGAAWDGTGSVWSAMPAMQRLEDALGDRELARQYRIRYGSDCKMLPQSERGLWVCTCGAINYEQEVKCHRCRRVYSALKNINVSSLRSESAQRVESEKQQDEQEQSEKRAARKKLIIALAVIIPLLIIALAALVTVPRYMQQKDDYAAAQTLLSAGRYDEAESAFAALGDYSDSTEKAEYGVPYARAVYLMECAAKDDVAGLLSIEMKRSDVAEGETVAVALYREAAKRFEALGNYKDSEAQLVKAQKAIEDYFDAQKRAAYDDAQALLDMGAYLKARDAFALLTDYADSEDKAKESLYQRALRLVEYAEKYFLQGVYAAFSGTDGEKSIIYIPQDVFAALGNAVSSDLRDILREDGVEINIETAPEEGVLPICEAIAKELNALGDYADSAQLHERALAAGDFTRPFYTKLSEGDVIGAYQWLSAYSGEFENRENWLALLQLYAPYCGTWELYMGDPTLIAQTVGMSIKCGAFTSNVVIGEDAAKLVIYPAGAEDYPIALTAALGTTGFGCNPDDSTAYYATISNLGRLTYAKYNTNGIQTGNQSCEYSKVG